jgi:predicted GH43/DUF377 family glycosyl hydrolase
MRIVLLPLLISISCVRVSELPDVGLCADYPDGTYEYGQIGIGDCISGPNDVQFVETGDDFALMVTNANPFRVFTGGSLLSIPWSSIDLGDESNEIDTLDVDAYPLPNFASGLHIKDNLGMVAIRESDDGRTRVYDDQVMLIDLTDPNHPVASDRGTNGTDAVEVMSDPIDIEIYSDEGYAFVANRTSHKISVLDMQEDEIKVIQPWPESVVTAAVYQDNSGANGQARLVDFKIMDETLLPNDTWSLTWVDGTWRLWLPTLDGLTRYTTHLVTDADGLTVYSQSPLGTELSVENASSVIDEISDPSHTSSTSGQMYFANNGAVYQAVAGEHLADWQVYSTPVLEGEPETWNAHLGGPNITSDTEQLWMYFDGQAEDLGSEGPSSIGAAFSLDGIAWEIDNQPFLEPTHPHEGDHIADPHIIFDAETLVWHMVYSAWDGDTWSIGHAVSEDLENWTADDTPMLTSAQGAAAPVLHQSVGIWHLWYSEWDGESWRIAGAESRDGVHWNSLGGSIEFEEGSVVHEESHPPGAALQGSATDGFQVRGEDTGGLLSPLYPGLTFGAIAQGWTADVLAGQWMDLAAAGPHSSGGVQVDSVHGNDDGTSTAWLSIESRSGNSRIGMSSIDADGFFDATWGATFEGGEANFERDGVSHPVVFKDGDSWRMLYAGNRNGKLSVGAATSSDGITWSSEGQVFKPSSDNWDSISVVPNSIVTLSNGDWRMWYSGFDGGRWRIGSATSSNGTSWTRDNAARGYQFPIGEPGTWDDSGVKDAWVIADEDGEHLWYAGFNGSNWRGGYAFRPSGQNSFDRTIHESSETERPVLTITGGLFHRSGIERPIVTQTGDGFDVIFAGKSGSTSRVGRAFGTAPDRLNKTPNRPRAGDALVFHTRRGDDNMEAIPLDGEFDGLNATGTGMTAISLDENRGLLYAVSKLNSIIYAIDVRDDSTPTYQDLNYLDVEAVIFVNTSVMATGFRQVVPNPQPDSSFIYALCDAPESIIAVDMTELDEQRTENDNLNDIPYAVMVTNNATGWLAAPRGNERDEGNNNISSVGPGQMLVHPDQRRLFVTNFNRNSITTYDLDIGPYGSAIHETRHVGENPYAMALSPDEQTIVFTNYTGDVVDNVSHANIGILDVNEASPTYLEVLSWVVNQ